MALEKGQKQAISTGPCYPAALKTKRVIWNQRRRLLACASSEAKRVMVMLVRDCGRVRALSELLWVVVVFGRKEGVRGFRGDVSLVEYARVGGCWWCLPGIESKLKVEVTVGVVPGECSNRSLTRRLST
jgi:hypothetical protein